MSSFQETDIPTDATLVDVYTQNASVSPGYITRSWPVTSTVSELPATVMCVGHVCQ